eukprot:CAMPEP_0181254268 /NCGR_PEP_ID=MMETSP1096-20121128/48510_1 /TAXON_ID=156174 ORGANISM="Chrysochromulina ericina, Strain CCMP281" /NCGR_SAMPLE_ID=MMETSP1096 /ASSEMBLY_ACC=CAM_ASM_000453 /LENGTH=118 /DNA_ID=CAMNT_0023352287 /DNA_START=406 /DNA_END=762 /DNA_ORIENTATION=-
MSCRMDGCSLCAYGVRRPAFLHGGFSVSAFALATEALVTTLLTLSLPPRSFLRDATQIRLGWLPPTTTPSLPRDGVCAHANSLPGLYLCVLSDFTSCHPHLRGEFLTAYSPRAVMRVA